MVRSYKPRTSRNKSNKENLEIASKSVEKEICVRKAAKQHRVDKMTLTRYMSRKQKELASTSGYKTNQLRFQVFNEAQEQELCRHVNELADKFYSVTSSTCRCLAYQFAHSNHFPIPKNWYESKMAG